MADVDGGLTRNASKRADSSDRVPLVSVAAVRFRCIDTNEIGSITLLPSDGDRARLERGDLLVVEGNGSKDQIGRVAIWDVDVPNARHQNHLIRVRPEGGMAPQLLLEWLASPGGRERLAKAATSMTGLYNLSLSKVAGIELPLAPLNEQRRIVAKIEVLTARSRTARKALEQVPPLLERFRQSVLAAAFRGDLTAEWRRQHPDAEPASILLERVRAERERESRWKAEVHTDALPPLPTGWCWASWADLADRVTVGYVGPMVKEYRPTGVPFLRSQNVRENRFDPEGLLHISREFHDKISKSALRPGDLVVVRSGSVGVTCAIPDSLGEEANCSDVVVIQRPQGVLSSYGSYYMNSAARGHVRAGAVGVALTHFNTKSVAGLPVPVPPAEEQREIVRILDARMAATRAVEAAAREQAERLAQLEQSILAKAFRGELVPQDPSDEPASVLLDRIHAERRVVATTASSSRRRGAPSNNGQDKSAARPRSTPDGRNRPARAER